VSAPNGQANLSKQTGFVCQTQEFVQHGNVVSHFVPSLLNVQRLPLNSFLGKILKDFQQSCQNSIVVIVQDILDLEQGCIGIGIGIGIIGIIDNNKAVLMIILEVQNATDGSIWIVTTNQLETKLVSSPSSSSS